MGSRYVWEKYNVEFSPIVWSTETWEYFVGERTNAPYVMDAYSMALRVTQNAYHQDYLAVLFGPGAGASVVYLNNPNSGMISCSSYPYILFHRVYSIIGPGTQNYDYGYYIIKAPPGAISWYKSVDGDEIKIYAWDDNRKNLPIQRAVASDSTPVKGTVSYGLMSRNNDTLISGSPYPTNGVNIYHYDYWYARLGTDNVDPTAITVNREPRAGETVTISVTPSSGKVYGGIVSYQFQYRINNGDWTDIQTTTNTSVSFAVPENAKSIQFRARAVDDIGFYSTDYVTTASSVVERLQLWVGINGNARKGTELYVGVDGKARKAVSAYVGVNGKARRFL